MRLAASYIRWNTNDYLRPSGAKATSGFPKEHGFGYEEWNNSPNLSFEEGGLQCRVFHTESVQENHKDFDDGEWIVFLYASHEGVQKLVGIAAKARCLVFEKQKRLVLAERLNLTELCGDAWNPPTVRRAYGDDYRRFKAYWDANVSWIPNWTCSEEYFLHLKVPVPIDAMRITEKTKLLSRFQSRTDLTRRQAMSFMESIPDECRSERWHKIVGVISSLGDDAGCIAADVSHVNEDPTLSPTEKKALIDARLGQGKFRASLEKRWDGRCAVTGCDQSEILRASHVKPWASSDNKERLNIANGLLLIANLDALFDRGLITFDERGVMQLSNLISLETRRTLGIPSQIRKPLNQKEKSFLEVHRQTKFRQQ